MRALLLAVCVAAAGPEELDRETLQESLGSVSADDEAFDQNLTLALGTPDDAPGILQAMPDRFKSPLEGLFPSIKKVKGLFDKCAPVLLVAKRKIATWSTEDGRVTAADAEWSSPATKTQLNTLLAETDKLDALLALGGSEMSQIRINLVSLADKEAERGTTFTDERQQNHALIQDMSSKLSRHLALLQKAIAATPDGTENGRTAIPVLTEMELAMKNMPPGGPNGMPNGGPNGMPDDGFSSFLELDGPDFGIGHFEEHIGELVKEEKARRDKIKAEIRAEDKLQEEGSSLMELRREVA